MKVFIAILKNQSSKKYPDFDVDFYISTRSKYANVGLGIPLTKINLHCVIISFIELQWNEHNETIFFLLLLSLI